MSSKTRGRIPELLRSIDDPTMLTLVNAVYLKAEWENWFWGTEPEPFTRPDGTKVDVPTMHRTAGGGCLSPPIAYAEGDGWRAVDLWTEAREEGKPLAMAVIVPDDLRAFEAALSSERLAGITATLDAERRTFSGGWVAPAPGDCPYDLGCYPYDVELHMPKFGVETRAPLAGVLSSLGMPDAFDASRADLSGTHVPEGAADQLYVTGLIHQANVSIDERGIEAAAATALGSGCEGPGPYQKHTLHVDRPFLFTIRDVETGAVLFMGRVVDPSTGS